MPLRLILAASAGLLLSVAYDAHAWAGVAPLAPGWLAPLGPAGLLLAAHGTRIRGGLLVGLVFGTCFYFTHIWWMRAVGTDAWLALAGIETAFYCLLGGATAILVRHPWWPLWFPAAWTATETIRSGWPFSGMPWGRLAFATPETPLAQAAPYVGATGLGFLLALLGTLLAAAWLHRGAGRRRVALPVVGAVGTAALLLLPALLPWSGLAAAAPEGRTRVAVVQGNVPGDGSDILLDHRQVTANHVEATVELGRRIEAGDQDPVDLVLWPENSTAVDPFSDAATRSGIETAVAAVGVPVLVGGIVDAGPDHVLNQGIVWDPETGPGERYTKWHPVPFGEYVPWREQLEAWQFGRLREIPRDMVAGTRTSPLWIGDTAIADAICFDIAYDDGIRAQVRRGAELLVVQTSNAMFIHTDQIHQQFAITRLRAIETGRFVAVASPNGVSGVIGPDGSVRATAEPRTRDVLVADVGLDTTLTPAMLLGAWPGRAFVAVSALGLLLGALAYRRHSPQQVGTRPSPHVADHRRSEASVGT